MSGHNWLIYAPTPLIGAVRTTQRQKWVDPRWKAYQGWKTAFRLHANREGIPKELRKDSRYSVDILIHWRKRARCDADNLIKAALDALFEQDRRVLDIRCHTDENTGGESMRVSISESSNRFAGFIGRTKRRGEIHPREVPVV